MQYYQTKAKKLKGKDFKEVHRIAFGIFLEIKKKSNRKPYIRSTFFGRDKVFLDFYWEHLFGKENWRDRLRRIKFFPAGLELIRQSNISPFLKQDPNKKEIMLHRFSGRTADGDEFFVQIKEFKKTGKKYLISIFPA